MARVSPVASSALPPRIAEVYETYASAYGPFRNQVEVMAHVPAAVEHIPALLMELKRQKAVPWRYIELAIVVVSKLNACSTMPTTPSWMRLTRPSWNTPSRLRRHRSVSGTACSNG